MGEPPVMKKCFNDPIHKHIELHPLLSKFINTPQFQRLKNIKQLGGNYFLYPGASHNRFEHSIGVCHLAGELVRHLQSTQPELNIDEKDVLCVELAGLCHDLGHGTYSHMFDKVFLRKMNKLKNNNQSSTTKNLEHEERSCSMFDRLLQDNPIVEREFRKLLTTDGETNETDITQYRNVIFIKEMINGPIEKDKEKMNNGQISEVDFQEVEQKLVGKRSWRYEGREREKGFLYEIVANHRNGVDVDKWDYFARDCLQLGIANGFDHVRFMKNMRVLDCAEINSKNEEEKRSVDYQICVRDKECSNLYEMFHTRDILYRRASKHRISNVVECMISDAMVLVNGHMKLKGKDGKELTIDESVNDMEAFEKITDNVIHQMYYSSDPSDASDDEKEARKEARKMMRRVFDHDYYVYIGSKKVPEDKVSEEEDSEDVSTVESKVDMWIEKENKSFKDIFEGLEAHWVFPLQEAYFHYGMKSRNPVENYLFYSKSGDEEVKPKRIKREEVSHMLPKHFIDVELEVYCKSKEKEIEKEFKKRFNEWKKK